LYIIFGCPWAHRANIVWSLKRLQPLIQRVVISGEHTEERSWIFNGANGTDPVDPLYGLTDLASLYRKASPDYKGRFTVPVVWDKKKETIVSNESADIIRMLATAFDPLLPEQFREEYKEAHGGSALCPAYLTAEIDELNQWVYTDVNNGVYRVGFAKSQEAYDEAIRILFAGIDRLEKHLATRGSKYLLGDHITEADIR
jgi:glutathionyl-hydroquinone reductase